MKRYVILGGGCSFAVHLARHLLYRDQTEQVIGVGRSELKAPCFTLSVPEMTRYSYFHIDAVKHQKDLLVLLDKWEPNVIINFAAEGESRASFEQSWRYFDVNCTGMARLAEELQTRSYLQRFVHISTGEVYGSVDHPVREDEPTRPTSPYAASKAAFDAYLMALGRKGSLRFNIVRPANTYGEGQQLHRFIPKAILFGLTGQRIPLYGSGHGIKSYLHAEDLARAIYLLTESAPLSRIYNIAPKMPITMRDIADEIARQLELPISALCRDIGMRKGTDARYWFDCSAAERDFGWTPQVDLETGIRRVVNWVSTNLDQLKSLPTEYEMAA